MDGSLSSNTGRGRGGSDKPGGIGSDNNGKGGSGNTGRGGHRFDVRASSARLKEEEQHVGGGSSSGIKRKPSESPLDSQPVKQERRDSPPPIKNKQRDSPEQPLLREILEAPAPDRGLATFNETHTRFTHENRTFHFSQPLQFVRIIENNVPKVYGTDNIDRLRQEVGPCEPIDERPANLPLGQCKLYTSLHVFTETPVGSLDGTFHLFSDRKAIRPFAQQHESNPSPANLEKLSNNLMNSHRAIFTGATSEEREALRNNGIPLSTVWSLGERA